MNTSNVISADAAVNLTGKEYHIVKLTATGVDLAATTNPIIGTLLRAQPVQEDGVYLGKSVGIQLWPGSVHYAVMGASTAAVAKGAALALDPANPGRLIPAGANPVIATAFDAFTSALGAIVRVVFQAQAGGVTDASSIVVPQAGTAQVSTADGNDPTSTQTLANALKAELNAIQGALVTAGILS